MELMKEYQRVLREEFRLRTDNIDDNLDFGMLILDAPEIKNLTWRILETAKSSTVPRSYVKKYHMSLGELGFESVGAHTNLVVQLVTSSLRYIQNQAYGPVPMFDGFSLFEIIEAVQLHDLAENETGDIPDDGARDEKEKQAVEAKYFRHYTLTYPDSEILFQDHVLELLDQFEKKSTTLGRLIYSADKIAATLIALVYDKTSTPPIVPVDDQNLSPRDRETIKICEIEGRDQPFFIHASEMWTADYLCGRKLCEYDDFGFFTAILVMATLMYHDKWYEWREEDYT